jgi:hypothetical protein
LNNTATTTYTFTPTQIADQCLNTNTLTIEINSATIPAGNSNQNFISGNTISNIIVSPTNVIWYSTMDDALAGTNPLSSNTVLLDGATYYAVNVEGDCRSDVFAVTVNTDLGVNENYIKEIAVYPNPAKNTFTIDFLYELISNYTIKINNLLGQEVYSNFIDKPQIKVTKTWQGEGIYFVKIYNENKNLVGTKKIILQ